MKWFTSLCIACAFAFVAPQFAAAQPHPGKNHPGPSAGPHAGKNHHDDDKDRDRDKNHHNNNHPGMNNHPGAQVHHTVQVHHTPVVHVQHVNKPVVHVQHVTPAPAPVIVVSHHPDRDGMHPREFESLLHSVRHSAMKSDKIHRIKSAAHNNRFTSHQAEQLIRTLKYDSDKIEVACVLAKHIVDPQNWYKVYDAFSYRDSRHRVDACLR